MTSVPGRAAHNAPAAHSWLVPSLLADMDGNNVDNDDNGGVVVDNPQRRLLTMGRGSDGGDGGAG